MGNICLIGCLILLGAAGFWVMENFDRLLEENYHEREVPEQENVWTACSSSRTVVSKHLVDIPDKR